DTAGRTYPATLWSFPPRIAAGLVCCVGFCGRGAYPSREARPRRCFAGPAYGSEPDSSLKIRRAVPRGVQREREDESRCTYSGDGWNPRGRPQSTGGGRGDFRLTVRSDRRTEATPDGVP